MPLHATRFCFAQLLEDDLDKVNDAWNTHQIRRSRHDTISGRPDELLFLPEFHGGVDGLLHPVLDYEIYSEGEPDLSTGGEHPPRVL